MIHEPPCRGQRAWLVMFVFLVGAFVFLAFRYELTDNRQQNFMYEMCVARNVNVERLNSFNQGMIKIEDKNPFRATSPETVEERIQLYHGAMQVAPVRLVEMDSTESMVSSAR